MLMTYLHSKYYDSNQGTNKHIKRASNKVKQIKANPLRIDSLLIQTHYSMFSRLRSAYVQ